MRLTGLSLSFFFLLFLFASLFIYRNAIGRLQVTSSHCMKEIPIFASQFGDQLWYFGGRWRWELIFNGRWIDGEFIFGSGSVDEGRHSSFMDGWTMEIRYLDIWSFGLSLVAPQFTGHRGTIYTFQGNRIVSGFSSHS